MEILIEELKNMASTLSPQRIKELKEYLAEHPIDHSLDELFEHLDAELPAEQATARMIYTLLKDLGET